MRIIGGQFVYAVLDYGLAALLGTAQFEQAERVSLSRVEVVHITKDEIDGFLAALLD
jgi:hypothetical protein